MTERLLIRPFTGGDAAAAHALYSDPEVMRFSLSTAFDVGATRARLEAQIAHQREHGFGTWAVIERAGGRLVGDCGLEYLDGGPDIELGYHFARDRWGPGYATEAARACLAWALAERPERVVAIVDPANAASLRVLEKIGLRRAGTADHFGRRWLLFLADRPA